MSESVSAQTGEKFLKLDTERLESTRANVRGRRLPLLPATGYGTSEVAQTALAVLALVAAGKTDHPATLQGIQFLIENQEKDKTRENRPLEWSSEEVDEGGMDISPDDDPQENELVIYSFCQYKKAQERNRTFSKEMAFFSNIRSAVPKLKIFSPD